MTGHTRYEVTCPKPVPKWSFLPDQLSSLCGDRAHTLYATSAAYIGVKPYDAGRMGCGCEEAALVAHSTPNTSATAISKAAAYACLTVYRRFLFALCALMARVRLIAVILPLLT